MLFNKLKQVFKEEALPSHLSYPLLLYVPAKEIKLHMKQALACSGRHFVWRALAKYYIHTHVTWAGARLDDSQRIS